MKVNPVNGGYSSDDESDSDNGKDKKSFLGNKNTNYYKSKNTIHITSRY